MKDTMHYPFPVFITNNARGENVAAPKHAHKHGAEAFALVGQDPVTGENLFETVYYSTELRQYTSFEQIARECVPCV